MAHISEKAEHNYAQVVFDLSSPEELEKRHAALVEWTKVAQEVPELQTLLENPSFPENEKNRILCETMQELCPDDQIMKNFIVELASNRRLSELGRIVSDLTSLMQKAKGIIAADVTSAFEINEDEKRELQAAMEQALGVQLAINWIVDSKILGGLIVKAGDAVIDNSLSGAVGRIRRDLLA